MFNNYNHIHHERKRALVLFHRSPEIEADVKPLGNLRVSSQAHLALLKHTLTVIADVKLQVKCDVIIADDNPSGGESGNVFRLCQKGNTFGERFENILRDVANKGYQEIIVVGTDTPGMSSSEIVRAFQSLEVNDVVLGPSLDGGNYLIGARTEVFFSLIHPVQWQTSLVHLTFLTNAAYSGLSVCVLKTLADIDSRFDMLVWIENTKRFSEYSLQSLHCLLKKLFPLLPQSAHFGKTFLPLARPKRLRLESQKAPPQL